MLREGRRTETHGNPQNGAIISLTRLPVMMKPPWRVLTSHGYRSLLRRFSVTSAATPVGISAPSMVCPPWRRLRKRYRPPTSHFTLRKEIKRMQFGWASPLILLRSIGETPQWVWRPRYGICRVRNCLWLLELKEPYSTSFGSLGMPTRRTLLWMSSARYVYNLTPYPTLYNSVLTLSVRASEMIDLMKC